jgi:two-component system cell cycle sensor histidine kinase/response regulator CckA
VQADRSQLARAIHNLFVHARSAMPAGGIILVEAANETLGGQTTLPVPPGRYVRLTIEDRGAAIPKEQLPTLFDPYAAAKFGSDRFALAITYSIIRRHNGHIDVRSEPGSGTIFDLRIPAAEAAPARSAPASQTPAPGVDFSGARILVMDDEATIRHLTERLLRRMNCVSTLVADGEACIRAYREAMEAGRKYDAVILDLTVPGGMGGKEALAALRAIDPTVRAIVSSGYSHDPVLANPRDFGFQAVVAKPFDLAGLADAIRRVLPAAARPG